MGVNGEDGVAINLLRWATSVAHRLTAEYIFLVIELLAFCRAECSELLSSSVQANLGSRYGRVSSLRHLFQRQSLQFMENQYRALLVREMLGKPPHALRSLITLHISQWSTPLAWYIYSATI